VSPVKPEIIQFSPESQSMLSLENFKSKEQDEKIQEDRISVLEGENKIFQKKITNLKKMFID